MKLERGAVSGCGRTAEERANCGYTGVFKNRPMRRIFPCFFLMALTVFFCWLEVGQFGVFGSKVDWISQHSVFPEYFRQLFYETGELFPEFAANIGGGQNIYNFAYYGLYNPLILPAYFLPGIKMSDYLMAVSVLTLSTSVAIFYCWLRHRGFSFGISLGTAAVFLLAGPMIFHSARHVMFVDYMPFLCMGLWGVDRYFEKNRRMGLYTISVFLMIMTSFYYSVGGLLVLVLYGLHRYLALQEAASGGKCELHSGQGKSRRRPGRPAFSASGRQSTITCRIGACARFLGDGVRFLLPMFCGIMMSAVLLLPAASALLGKRSGGAVIDWAMLLTPDFSAFRLLYGTYGIGLTSLLFTSLIAGIAWRKKSGRVLVLGCMAIVFFPIFCWLLNGGLYAREKTLIPFLPLCCYIIACYCSKTGAGVRRGSKKQLLTGVIPYLLTLLLLLLDCGESLLGTMHPAALLMELPGVLNKAAQTLLPDLMNGSLPDSSQEWLLVLIDGILMLLCYMLFVLRVFCPVLRKKPASLDKSPGIVLRQAAADAPTRGVHAAGGNPGWVLLLFPVLFLILYGASFHGTANIENGDFYEQITDTDIGETVRAVLHDTDHKINSAWRASAAESEDGSDTASDFVDGMYRMEQYGTYSENKANANRVWSTGQYITSVYSSACNPEYLEFCTHTFGIEEPTRSYGNQPVSANPVFRRLMGVKYLLTSSESAALEAQGYTLIHTENGNYVYENDMVAPMAYVTNQVISEDTYSALAFPYNQSALAAYAVIGGEISVKPEENADAIAALQGNVTTTELIFSDAAIADEGGAIEQTGNGYRINSEKTVKIQADIASVPADERGEDTDDDSYILYVQFAVRNWKHFADVTILVEGMQNKLSAESNIYYNGNTIFTYALALPKGQTEVEFSFGAGSYEIADLQCCTQTFLSMDKAAGQLFQSVFLPDDSRTAGNRIAGTVEAAQDGWFITSIPYDDSFTVKVDGQTVSYQRVNTAFLGFPVYAGDHDIEIIYHAPGLAAGKVLSLLGILLFFCLHRPRILRSRFAGLPCCKQF